MHVTTIIGDTEIKVFPTFMWHNKVSFETSNATSQKVNIDFGYCQSIKY